MSNLCSSRRLKQWLISEVEEAKSVCSQHIQQQSPSEPNVKCAYSEGKMPWLESVLQIFYALAPLLPGRSGKQQPDEFIHTYVLEGSVDKVNYCQESNQRKYFLQTSHTGSDWKGSCSNQSFAFLQQIYTSFCENAICLLTWNPIHSPSVQIERLIFL